MADVDLEKTLEGHIRSFAHAYHDAYYHKRTPDGEYSTYVHAQYFFSNAQKAIEDHVSGEIDLDKDDDMIEYRARQKARAPAQEALTVALCRNGEEHHARLALDAVKEYMNELCQSNVAFIDAIYADETMNYLTNGNSITCGEYLERMGGPLTAQEVVNHIARLN